ncbi:CBS domain-containing protein [Halobacteriovorax sp. GB3]|uniref:CBS domain-containing protein n=1 Tax=Halobacteriovorax sp. GB3 TaxID=2719615 RepID=UPI00235F9DC0|nr:CBS domain-containing protein [Halobacteriovorax sp. GB3]MDD0853093.1 CBS domain-containing protein [Halobacteriovorax sp. GB3]
MNQLLDLLDHTIQEMGMSDPKYIQGSDSLEKAIKMMQEFKIGSALVIDEKVNLLGIITERDLLMKVMGKGVDLSDQVSNYMTANPKTVAANESLIVALSLMSREGFRHLPVVNLDKKPIGIISIRDIMSYFTNHLHDEL